MGTVNISRSIEYIEQNLTEPLSVETLADNAFFSRRYYQSLFARTVGENVMEYVRKRRLTLAAEDLVSTSENVVDIAFKYGYDSPEGFSRAFKAYHSVTPSDCRKFGLFRSRKSFKEMKPMAQLKIAADFVSHFEKMSQTIRALADRTFSAERESGVPGNVFSGFAGMTNSLADKMEQYADQLRAFSAKERNFGEYSAKAAEMIKTGEDTAFTLRFIRFNVGLNVARTQELYRGKLLALADEYDSAALDCAFGQQKFNDLVAEFLQNAKADIKAEWDDRKAEREQLLSGLRRQSAAVAAFVKNAAEQTKIGSFGVLADEIARLQIDDTDEAALKARLLSITAQAELARTPGIKPLISAAEQISSFTERLAKEHGEVIALNADIVQLDELLNAPSPPSEPPSEPPPEEQSYIAGIFMLYAKLEREKL
ncbi:MAG: AraC family transcriptional regulator, partial [Clostridiales bacterium]|nr:AraC family transcriptional regulator [Clostridiales bacterium]